MQKLQKYVLTSFFAKNRTAWIWFNSICSNHSIHYYMSIEQNLMTIVSEAAHLAEKIFFNGQVHTWIGNYATFHSTIFLYLIIMPFNGFHSPQHNSPTSVMSLFSFFSMKNPSCDGERNKQNLSNHLELVFSKNM